MGSADGLLFLQPNLFLTHINQRSETLTLDFGLFLILGFSFTGWAWSCSLRGFQSLANPAGVARATTTSSHAGHGARARIRTFLFGP